MLPSSLTHPVLVTVSYTDNQDVAVLLNSVDDEMGFEWMDAHWRRQFVTLPRHAWIGSNQVEYREKFIMISSRLYGSEQGHSFLGNADNVIFRRQ